MAHPYHHALSSVRKWGGVPADYQPIHDWFDNDLWHDNHKRGRSGYSRALDRRAACA